MKLRNRGYLLNHKTVQMLIKEPGPKCMVNQKWAADVAGFSLSGRKLYLSPIPD